MDWGDEEVKCSGGGGGGGVGGGGNEREGSCEQRGDGGRRWKGAGLFYFGLVSLFSFDDDDDDDCLA